MTQETLALVIAPRRKIVRDFKANSGPLFVALAALGGLRHPLSLSSDAGQMYPSRRTRG